MRRIYLHLLLIFIIVLVLYFPVLNTFFSQDDFFHFKASITDGSIKSFINLFGFPTFDSRGYGFYRPLFREGLYNLYFKIFGLDHLPFRIFQFVIHFINISLVYILIQKLFNKRFLSFFTAFFFGISSANVATFYYLAGGIQAMGATMFTLLTLIFFWDYLKTNSLHKKALSFITFLLALASHELSSTIPLILALVIWSKFPPRSALTQIIKQLWPFFFILIIYLYLDIGVIGFSSGEEQYQLSFSIKRIINTISWYIVWAIGIPEMLLDFLEPGLRLNPNLFKYWGGSYRIILPSFLIAFAIMIYSFISQQKELKLFKDKMPWTVAFIFLTSLLPVLFLPLHKSSYYLYIGLWAFWGFIGFVVTKAPHKISGILIATLIILNITSIKLGEHTFWAAARGRLAEKILTQIKKTYPNLPKGSTVYFLNDPNYPYVAKDWGGTSKQASSVLNNQDALQLLYNDSTLKVYYEDIDKISDQERKKTFEIIAKLD